MELHTASHSRQRGHRRQRLARGTALLVSTAQVLRNGLAVLGVSAPEKM